MILRESQWKFGTSAGLGIGFDSFAADAGMFVLKDPSGRGRQYKYSGFGPDFSRALTSWMRVPKLALPKIIVRKGEISSASSTPALPGVGRVYLTSSFSEEDLDTPDRLNGGTIYLEGAAGYLFGGVGSFMLLGLNPKLLMFGIARPEFIGKAIQSAPAALAMMGANAGLQDSAGFSFMLGQVTYNGLYSDDPA